MIGPRGDGADSQTHPRLGTAERLARVRPAHFLSAADYRERPWQKQRGWRPSTGTKPGNCWSKGRTTQDVVADIKSPPLYGGVFFCHIAAASTQSARKLVRQGIFRRTPGILKIAPRTRGHCIARLRADNGESLRSRLSLTDKDQAPCR